MSVRGFISRLLARRRSIPEGPGKAHDDWAAGDLAQCVLVGEWRDLSTGLPFHGPARGEFVRVRAVTMLNGWHGLRLEGFGEAWWVAANFLKIRPDQAKRCTEGFRIRMRDIARKVDA